MTTSTHTPTTPNTPAHSMGFFEWLRTIVRRIFGGQSAKVAKKNGNPSKGLNEPQGDVIVAPGGLVIHKPRYAGASPIVDVDTVDSIVPEVRKGLDLLPPLPTVVLQLIKEIQNSTSTAASVAEIASSDPSLAASLLRAVNSSAFGLPTKVTSISQAVSLLGFGVVRSMMMRFHLEAILPMRSPQAAAAAQDIWTHSLAVSYIAAALSPRVKDVDQGFASTLGLLHDVGRLSICAHHPDFAAALKAVPAGKPLLEREAAAFGANHASIGARLGNQWQLPADLNTAIRWHHEPVRAFEATDPLPLRKAVALVQVADQLAKFGFAYSDDMEIDTPSVEAMNLLGLGESLQELLDAKVRAATTQAILFADETETGLHTGVRPFLRLRRDAQATEICDRLHRTAAPSIPTGTAGNELIDSCEKAYCHDPANPAGPTIRQNGQGRFAAPTTTAGIEWLAKTLPAQWEPAGVAPRVAACARATLRALLPNLLAEQNILVEVAWRWEARSLHLAVRSLAMEFAARVPAADMYLSGQLLAAELANLKNLGWFDIESSTNGATLFLRSR